LPAGLGTSQIWWALDQAVAVRRHGMSMMVVMAVMVAGLHLYLTIKRESRSCQMVPAQLRITRRCGLAICGIATRRSARIQGRLHQVNHAPIQAISRLEPL
jgi:hypothetical protein